MLLKLLRERSEVRAADLARDIGMEKADFKIKVRSPRGSVSPRVSRWGIGYRCAARQFSVGWETPGARRSR